MVLIYGTHISDILDLDLQSIVKIDMIGTASAWNHLTVLDTSNIEDLTLSYPSVPVMTISVHQTRRYSLRMANGFKTI